MPARVALGVTTLLTMSTQVRINHNHSHHPEEIFSQKVAGVSKSLPPVAYTKAIGENRLNSSLIFSTLKMEKGKFIKFTSDVWNGACVLFVFSALLEFAFVNYASR